MNASDRPWHAKTLGTRWLIGAALSLAYLVAYGSIPRDALVVPEWTAALHGIRILAFLMLVIALMRQLHHWLGVRAVLIDVIVGALAAFLLMFDVPEFVSKIGDPFEPGFIVDSSFMCSAELLSFERIPSRDETRYVIRAGCLDSVDHLHVRKGRSLLMHTPSGGLDYQ